MTFRSVLLGTESGLRRKGFGIRLTGGYLYFCGEGYAPGRGSFATDIVQRFGVNVDTYHVLKTGTGHGKAKQVGRWKRWV